jgi:PPOX class probable F420-dependent enzyme
VPADLDLVRRLAAADHGLAVVALAREDGSVQASLVNAGVIDEPSTGRPAVGFVAAGSAVKLPLLRRTGRATVVFRSGWEWVSVDGPVRLVGPDDGAGDDLPQLRRDVFIGAGGTHDDWGEFDRVMAAERRTAVFVDPQRITSNG